ncbi:MAG TPA: hypothetical protein VHI51_04205 [Ktedonobacterales bacterium]|jgi:hypothetical protein|nr:hypothetical protein [Ktedonobacterales bacterium]
MAVVVLGIVAFTRHTQNTPASGQPPAKPGGVQSTTSSTGEHWTLAKGLPSQVTALAFSDANPTTGYAVAFINKQTQAVYSTTDHGTSWSQAGTLQAPTGDFLATDPHDPRDVVVLSAYAPTVGTYTFERSFDGGRTWSAQTTTLPTTGMVSKIGWSDSTFLVGFQLDAQLQGSSAVVAFPRGGASAHLDANGKINGVSVAHLRLLTGRQGKMIVWGDDGSSAQNAMGAATSDLGQHWSALPSVTPGAKPGATLIPDAATDDDAAVVATSTDNAKVAISNDGGATWAALPAFTGAPAPIQGVFIAAGSRAVVIARGDGSWAVRNGAWSKVTSKQIAFLSASGPQHSARLWSFDAQGHVIWLDA